MERKVIDSKHKDKVRHGGKRQELLQRFGIKGKFQCSMCEVLGDSFMIVAHHVTGNNKDHDYQILLCRKCHTSLHMKLNNPRKKYITKEQVEDALSKHDKLDDAAKYLGISRSYLREKRIEYGFPERKTKKPISRAEFKKALDSTKNTKEAMKLLNIVSTETFFRKKRTFGFMTNHR